MDKVTIHIARVIGTGTCISSLDGHKVHDAIRAELLKDKLVELSFESVSRITTAFLNAAVGQLYGEFTEERIRSQLVRPINADNRILNRLKLVVDRAKSYFKDQKTADQIVSSAMGIREDDEDY